MDVGACITKWAIGWLCRSINSTGFVPAGLVIDHPTRCCFIHLKYTPQYLSDLVQKYRLVMLLLPEFCSLLKMPKASQPSERNVSEYQLSGCRISCLIILNLLPVKKYFCVYLPFKNTYLNYRPARHLYIKYLIMISM